MKEKVLRILTQAIQEKNIPGAVIQVVKDDEILLKEAIGYRIDNENKQQPMQEDTIFDLASLTKVVATLPAILKLLDEGLVALSDPVHYYIPAFNNRHKDKVTLFHLLTHTAGFKPFHKFYDEGLSKEDIFTEIYKDALVYEPGEKVIYSDLGFMLLMKIVEIASSQPFEQFVEQGLFKPLEMKETGFNSTFPTERYAATEFDRRIGAHKVGIVHDENAEALGGISGHAGLFSTIKDLGHYASLIENDGYYNGQQILSKEAIELSRINFTPFANDFRGIGWQLKRGPFTSCGDYFSDQSYGHTGFTGTSMWFDPAVKLHVILLTNRVHYGRQPEIVSLRARVHNVIRQGV